MPRRSRAGYRSEPAIAGGAAGGSSRLAFGVIDEDQSFGCIRLAVDHVAAINNDRRDLGDA